jgi:hypothetical protein
MIKVIDRGEIFRNPKPHLRAVNAWHPTLLELDDGELLASFDLGQGAESLDYRTYLSRSGDGGSTWSAPTRLIPHDTQHPTTHTARMTRLRDGSLVAFGARFHRDDPEEGLTHRQNMGFVPMDLILLRGGDGGRIWTAPQVIEPPLVGPAFEICHSIIELRDGTWLAPTSTWRGWDGHCPNGMKAVALVSHDQGKTWPRFLDVMDDYADGIIYLEQSIIQWPDGRLLAVSWAFDERRGTSREVQFAWGDMNRGFDRPRSTGLKGETSKIVHLGDDRILCIYRRGDQPGLWAAEAQVRDGNWNTIQQQPIWQGATTGMFGRGSASDELSNLKAGYPTIRPLANGQILVAFWCCIDGVFQIQFVRLNKG